MPSARTLTTFLFLLVLPLGQTVVVAQQKNSPNTLKLGSDSKSPSAQIEEVAWIAGHWKGEAFGGHFEETWNPPTDGSMMGMFRLSKNGEVSFYELLTIVEQQNSLLLRLKHFDKSLHGWEEKDETVDFPLVKLTTKEAFFEGLTFRKVNRETVHVFVVISQDGKAEEVKFELNLVREPAVSAGDSGDR